MKKRSRRKNKIRMHKYFVAILAASVILILSIIGIIFLYFSGFYPVYVNGQVDIMRKVIRYGLYALCFIFMFFSVGIMDCIIEKIKENASIKRYIKRLDK